jgi:hypothetical protein
MKKPPMLINIIKRATQNRMNHKNHPLSKVPPHMYRMIITIIIDMYRMIVTIIIDSNPYLYKTGNAIILDRSLPARRVKNPLPHFLHIDS